MYIYVLRYSQSVILATIVPVVIDHAINWLGHDEEYLCFAILFIMTIDGLVYQLWILLCERSPTSAVV